MAWPLSQDYNEAIQNPTQCFADPELRQGEAVTNALGLPIPCSGNFADVYAVQTPQRKWAVKCFTRQIPGIRERYIEVSKYLEQQQLPFMVEFKFLDQGIRVRGQWYPVLKMHWVEGFALNHFVRQQLDKPPVLNTLCQIWVKLAQRLREAQIAHCDLQHGNVLLVPGSRAGSLGVKLVDYDGMCVPALELLKSIELGHPSYQHPQRLREGTYGPDVDRFSHLVIYTALRALMVGGKALWDKHDNGDNLLFKQADFASPGNSPVFADLNRVNDPQVRKLVAVLAQVAAGPINEVPLLEELVPSNSPAQASPPLAHTSPPAQPRRVASPKQQLSEAPPETNESPFTGATSGEFRLRGRGKRRSYFTGAVVGAGMVAVFCFLALGVFMMMRSGDKETSSSAMAKAKGSASSVKDAPISKPETDSNQESKPETRPTPVTKPEAKEVMAPAAAMTARRSQTVGNNGAISPFENVGGEGAFLTGFAYGTRFEELNRTEIGFLQPVYWTPAGRKLGSGVGYQTDSKEHPIVEAKDGYAVGGLMLWSDKRAGFELVRGIKIQFMRRKGQTLDTKDTYWSDWLGLSGEGKSVIVGGDGNPVVGIYGDAGGAIDRLGIIQLPAEGAGVVTDRVSNPPGPKQQYLCDIQEFDVKVGEDRFAKKGNLGFMAGNPPNGRILVNGKESPNGLAMHAISNDQAVVKYKIAKTWQTFEASVALNDSAGAPGLKPGVGKIPTRLTFQVFGDGKLLWSSTPIDTARYVQECKVDVSGVDVLELRVDCPGPNINGQAVWLEPRVLLKDDQAQVQNPLPKAGWWTGEYWTNFTVYNSNTRAYGNMPTVRPTLVRNDPLINFNWGGGSPDPKISADLFCCRWTGTVTPTFTETYTFYTTTDDGSRLWINGKLVLDQWSHLGPTTGTATVDLTAGVPVNIRMEMFENYGAAMAKLEWSSPSQPREYCLPSTGSAQAQTAKPAPKMAGWVGQFWSNVMIYNPNTKAYASFPMTAPTLTRTDPQINFDWGGGSPDPKISADLFCCRWTGTVTPAFTETYTFHMTSSDGSRLWVNGNKVIDMWWLQGPTTRTATVNLTANVPVSIRMEMFKNYGGKTAKLEWSSATQPRSFCSPSTGGGKEADQKPASKPGPQPETRPAPNSTDAPLLVAALADKSKRESASADLIALGKDAVSEVIKALDHEDLYTRLAAIHVLSEIGPVATDAIPKLSGKAKTDPSATVRGAASKAITRIQGK